MEGFTCMACAGTASSPVHLDCQDHYLGKPWRVDYHRCQACALVQQSPLPADTTPFYDAYPVHGRKSALHRLMRRLVMAPVYFTGKASRPGEILLDFGCGDGWFLEAIASRGFERLGFEADPAHAMRLGQQLGVPVLSDLEELLARYTGTIDVLTQHFVLEHLPDLDEAFATAARLLRPGGLYFYVVPAFDCWESRLFGKRWHSLDPPRHLSFPQRAAAERLAARHGLQLAEDRALPFPNGFAGSVPVMLTGKFNFPLFLLALPFGIVLARLFPQGNRGFWLRKPVSAA